MALELKNNQVKMACNNLIVISNKDMNYLIPQNAIRM